MEIDYYLADASWCMLKIDHNRNIWPDLSELGLLFLGRGFLIDVWLILEFDSFAENQWNQESGICPSQENIIAKH